MGSSSSSSSKQVLLLGLPNSGKTTFLQRLTDSQANESDQINYDPTLGVNYTSLTINSLNFDFWDLGGDKVSATLWSTYYRIIHVGIVLFFVDISDINSFNDHPLSAIRFSFEYSFSFSTFSSVDKVIPTDSKAVSSSL